MAVHAEEWVHSRLCLYKEAEKMKSLADVTRLCMIQFIKSVDHESLLLKVRKRSILEFKLLRLEQSDITNWQEFVKAKKSILLVSGLDADDVTFIFDFEYNENEKG